MNIFYVNEDPLKAARDLCDTHVLSQVKESTQMLASVYHLSVADINPPLKNDGTPYKRGYWNHPCQVWVRESRNHWLWLIRHAMGLGDEYFDRYGKRHACCGPLSYMQSRIPHWLPDVPFVAPPQCMPKEYQHSDTLTAYREYYRLGKSHLHKWRLGNKPAWLTQPVDSRLLA